MFAQSSAALRQKASPWLAKRLEISMELGFEKFRWEGAVWWHFSDELWFWEEEIF